MTPPDPLTPCTEKADLIRYLIAHGLDPATVEIPGGMLADRIRTGDPAKDHSINNDAQHNRVVGGL